MVGWCWFWCVLWLVEVVQVNIVGPCPRVSLQTLLISLWPNKKLLLYLQRTMGSRTFLFSIAMHGARLQDWRCNQETVQWMKKYKSCTCCPPFSLSISFYWALFDELTEPTSPHMFSRVHKGCVENQLHKIKLDTQQKCQFEIKTSVVRNCTKSNVTILSQLTVTAQWKKSTVTVKLPGR